MPVVGLGDAAVVVVGVDVVPTGTYDWPLEG
jgi:hypothetical protein